MSVKWVGILPFAFRPFYEKCRATMHPDFAKNVLFIDDTDPDNRIGIPRAHNRGIDYMRQKDADWLVIISAAIRFGRSGGLDFIQVLADHPDHYIIHAATANVKGGLQHKQEGKDQKNGVFGQHLTAVKREVFDKVGKYDELFGPYGFEDVDFHIRVQHHYKGAPGWDTYPVDVTDTIMSHSISLGKVVSPSEPRIAYFATKWGRHPGAYMLGEYEFPFNDPKNSLAYWPPAPNGGKWDD